MCMANPVAKKGDLGYDNISHKLTELTGRDTKDGVQSDCAGSGRHAY